MSDYGNDEFADITDLEDQLSLVVQLAKGLDPEEVAQAFDREARKLRNPEVLEGEILDPEDGV